VEENDVTQQILGADTINVNGLKLFFRIVLQIPFLNYAKILEL
jgi:hypothetical protein